MTDRAAATRPLDGIVVVALEQAVAMPLATRHLADAGARVIKVEPKGEGDFARYYDDALGHGYSTWFLWLNRGKESIELDLRDPEDLEVLRALIGKADVVVQNMAPGALERKGIDLAALRAEYPRLITCSLTGYGPDGPYRDRRAYDLLVQNETGLVSLTGTPDAAAKVGVSVADISGGMYCHSNILLALLARERTGEGSHVEVALFDTLLEWLGHQVLTANLLQRLPRRAGARHATIAPYGPFPCSDGEVVIAVQNTREWNDLCDALDLGVLVADERFSNNEGRVANAAALDAAITERTTALSCDALVTRLEARNLAWARVNDMFDVIAHPQLTARNRWVEVEAPNGAFLALRPPLDFSSFTPAIGPIPALGEHTDAIKAWVRQT
ncbi:MAG: CaiB/BaiF CoA transferase family protein [Acidimicrobiia bacterium]